MATCERKLATPFQGLAIWTDKTPAQATISVRRQGLRPQSRTIPGLRVRHGGQQRRAPIRRSCCSTRRLCAAGTAYLHLNATLSAIALSPDRHRGPGGPASAGGEPSKTGSQSRVGAVGGRQDQRRRWSSRSTAKARARSGNGGGRWIPAGAHRGDSGGGSRPRSWARFLITCGMLAAGPPQARSARGSTAGCRPFCACGRRLGRSAPWRSQIRWRQMSSCPIRCQTNSVVVLVHDRVSLATGHHPAVDRGREQERH